MAQQYSQAPPQPGQYPPGPETYPYQQGWAPASPAPTKKSRTGLYIVVAVVIVVIVVIAALALVHLGSSSNSSSSGGTGPSSNPLVVSDSASAYSGQHPLTVAFSSSVSGGTPPYTYSWSLGDGTTSTASSPSDTYTLRGSYTVSLTVTDSKDATQSPSALTITVNPVDYTTTVADSTTESIGAGDGGGLLIPFTVPTIGAAPDAVAASITGSIDVTACTGLGCTLAGDNLLSYDLIGTPSEISNIESGGSVTVIWCYTAGGTSCLAEQNVQISLDLSSYSGQTLDLYMYNTNLVDGQTATVDVSITYSA